MLYLWDFEKFATLKLFFDFLLLNFSWHCFIFLFPQLETRGNGKDKKNWLFFSCSQVPSQFSMNLIYLLIFSLPYPHFFFFIMVIFCLNCILNNLCRNFFDQSVCLRFTDKLLQRQSKNFFRFAFPITGVLFSILIEFIKKVNENKSEEGFRFCLSKIFCCELHRSSFLTQPSVNYLCKDVLLINRASETEGSRDVHWIRQCLTSQNLGSNRHTLDYIRWYFGVSSGAACITALISWFDKLIQLYFLSKLFNDAWNHCHIWGLLLLVKNVIFTYQL